MQQLFALQACDPLSLGHTLPSPNPSRHAPPPCPRPPDVFPQDYYPAPRPLSPAAVDEYEAEAAELAGAWQRVVAKGEAGGATPAARLHAALVTQQVAEVGNELRRLHGSVGAAIDGLHASQYGFLGFPCCKPAA